MRSIAPYVRAPDEAIDDAIYAPYLARSARLQPVTDRLAFRSFDFAEFLASNEMRERCGGAARDLDQASRVPGITPAALSALHFALSRTPHDRTHWRAVCRPRCFT